MDIDAAVQLIDSITRENRDGELKKITMAVFRCYTRLSKQRHIPQSRTEIMTNAGITQIRKQRRKQLFLYLQNPQKLIEPSPISKCSVQTDMPEYTFNCHICKKSTNRSHSFYFAMCVSCGNFNYEKRNQMLNLHGKIAIVTGGRIKIGFETAIKLLLSGANVIVTSRFITDTCLRFQSHPQFSEFRDRLCVKYLDLNNIESIEQFIKFMHLYERIDILINNAAQTIRRDNEFYKRELELDQKYFGNLISATIEQQQIAEENYDEYGQPIVNIKNSWDAKLQDISFEEAKEVHIINAVAPLMLIKGLYDLFSENSHIINVSSMEGSFSRNYKSSNHVHTNMAKASLNMITRTLALEFAEKKIYMNSVDTGWIDNMHGDQKNSFIPLDIVDGAARILDPIFLAINGNVHYGVFFKDYSPTQW